MTIVRWEPLRELHTLQSEMNRLFTTMFDTPDEGARSGARRWLPSMDLVERGDEYILRADLPGVSQEDVNIEIEENVLTISGERKADHHESTDGFVRIERSFGAFSRSLTLPKGVDAEAVTAQFVDGVLTLRVPKPEQAKPRRIQIAVGDQQNTIESSAS